MNEAAEIRDWLIGVEGARAVEDPEEIIAGLGTRLIAAGVPVDRLMLAIGVLHSERRGLGRFWEPGEKTRTEYFPYGEQSQALYDRSPFRVAQETGAWVDFRLADTPDEMFGIVGELREAGFTHYICIPVTLPGGSQNGMSFATKRAEGFSDNDKAVIASILPAYSALLEIMSLRRVADDVLRIYVGDEPHRRILSGQIRRGDVIHIRSAIFFADMRGFTALSMGLNAGELVELLNDYYDCIVPHVEAHGGEVLEFMGDGVMAIFRADEGEEDAACERAFAAARAALEQLEARNASQPKVAYNVGIALHFGRAAYGNIGSGERLDYTVIGRDVNLASRIAGLCASLSCSLLVSKAFSEHLTACSVRSIGEHELRGVVAAQEIFEPLGDAPCPDRGM